MTGAANINRASNLGGSRASSATISPMRDACSRAARRDNDRPQAERAVIIEQANTAPGTYESMSLIAAITVHARAFKIADAISSPSPGTESPRSTIAAPAACCR